MYPGTAEVSPSFTTPRSVSAMTRLVSMKVRGMRQRVTTTLTPRADRVRPSHCAPSGAPMSVLTKKKCSSCSGSLLFSRDTTAS